MVVVVVSMYVLLIDNGGFKEKGELLEGIYGLDLGFFIFFWMLSDVFLCRPDVPFVSVVFDF